MQLNTYEPVQWIHKGNGGNKFQFHSLDGNHLGFLARIRLVNSDDNQSDSFDGQDDKQGDLACHQQAQHSACDCKSRLFSEK